MTRTPQETTKSRLPLVPGTPLSDVPPAPPAFGAHKGHTIPISKAQFLNDGIPAIPGIGSQTVLIGEKQKQRERNPSTVIRTVTMEYQVDSQLLSVKSRDKEGIVYTTLVPFGAIKAMQVETE